MDFVSNITKTINNSIKNLNDDLRNSKFLNSLQDSIKNIINEASQSNNDNIGNKIVFEEKKEKEEKLEKEEDKNEEKGLSVIDTQNDYIYQDSEVQKKYLGCFNDGQGQPLFGYRFPQKVKNIKECIDLGEKSKYKYVALKNGNECWAGNSKYNANGEVEKKLCNIQCENPKSQTCGGSIFNQVYKTNYYKPEEIQSKILNQMNPVMIDIDFRDGNINSNSNFPNNNDYINNIEDKIYALTKETFSNSGEMMSDDNILKVERMSGENILKEINLNLDEKDFECAQPITNNFLFLYIVIIVLIVTIIYLYFDKKK